MQDSQEMNRLSSWMFQVRRRKELKLFEKEVTEDEDERLAKHKVESSSNLANKFYLNASCIYLCL